MGYLFMLMKEAVRYFVPHANNRLAGKNILQPLNLRI